MKEKQRGGEVASQRKHEASMRKTSLALVGLLILTFSVGGQTPPQITGGGSDRGKKSKSKKLTLQSQIAQATGEKEEVVAKILKALGPAVVDAVNRGEKVDFPGMGTLRVVQIQESQRRIGDRPVVIPARNYIEMLPSPALTQAANSPAVVPDQVIPQYNPEPLLPHTPGQRVPSGSFKTPRTRTGN